MNVIERLKELNEKATPAPWTTYNVNFGGLLPSNVDLVFALRNNLPAILQLIEAGMKLRPHLPTSDLIFSAVNDSEGTVIPSNKDILEAELADALDALHKELE